MSWYEQTKNFYDKFADERGLDSFYPGRLRKRNLTKILNGLKVKTALDLGCGTGRWLNFLKPISDKVFGCDFSKNRIKKIKDFSLVLADCTDTPYKSNSFDLILCVELIQHVDPNSVNQTVREIERLLKRKGRLILITKNGEKSSKSIPKNPIIWFTREELTSLFKKFDVYFMGDRILPDKLTILMIRPLSWVIERIDSFLSRKLIRFSDSIIMVGIKK